MAAEYTFLFFALIAFMAITKTFVFIAGFVCGVVYGAAREVGSIRRAKAPATIELPANVVPFRRGQ